MHVAAMKPGPYGEKSSTDCAPQLLPFQTPVPLSARRARLRKALSASGGGMPLGLRTLA
jgi:hypothetical protein